MDEIIEEIFNGFCRCRNMTQMVTCEYERQPAGLKLMGTDCAYGSCVHSGSCDVIRQALDREKEG